MYKPTTAKYKGVTHTYYLTYDLPMTMRFRDNSTKRVVVPRVRKLYISGALVKHTKRPKIHTLRTGSRVYGIKVTYRNPRETFYKSSFVGKHGKLRGVRVSGARIPKTRMLVNKVAVVPRNAKNVKLRKKLPKKYKKALMDVK